MKSEKEKEDVSDCDDLESRKRKFGFSPANNEIRFIYFHEENLSEEEEDEKE